MDNVQKKMDDAILVDFRDMVSQNMHRRKEIHRYESKKNKNFGYYGTEFGACLINYTFLDSMSGLYHRAKSIPELRSSKFWMCGIS